MPVLGALPGAPQTSSLDILLMAEWEDRAEQGLFRYDVTACPCKVLPGPYGFVAQLNEGRASKKRPTEFRIDQVPSMPSPRHCYPPNSASAHTYALPFIRQLFDAGDF